MQKLGITAGGYSTLQHALFEILPAALIFIFSFSVGVGLLTKPVNSRDTTKRIIKSYVSLKEPTMEI
jgi:hypothetical protein